MIRNVIYDFDGTLFDTAPDILDCLEKTYSNNQINLKNGVKDVTIGPPLNEMIKCLSPEADNKFVESLVLEFRKIYNNYDHPKTKLYPGVLDLLKNLNCLNIKQFVATYKPIIPTKRIIDKFNIDYFNDIVAHDVIPDRKMTKVEMLEYICSKFEINPDETIMIGDSESDIAAAIEMKMISCYVLYGYGKNDKILKLKPKYVVNEIEEVNKIIKEM